MVSTNVILVLERRQIDAITAKRRVPEFAPGDTVKVMVKVMEGTEADAKDKKRGAAKPKEEDKGPGFRLQAFVRMPDPWSSPSRQRSAHPRSLSRCPTWRRGRQYPSPRPRGGQRSNRTRAAEPE